MARHTGGVLMGKDAKECFDTAASLLQQTTGCEPSVASEIVQMIALGTIRWQSENAGAADLGDEFTR